jgi:hypothetical protein
LSNFDYFIVFQVVLPLREVSLRGNNFCGFDWNQSLLKHGFNIECEGLADLFDLHLDLTFALLEVYVGSLIRIAEVFIEAIVFWILLGFRLGVLGLVLLDGERMR